jgi:exodeoxyribonuclease VII small subunit
MTPILLKYRTLFPAAPTRMPKPRASTAPKDYESALAELDTLVADMEAGQLSLEASLAAYKRGTELLAFCRQQLAAAEQQVQILENGTLQPFRSETTDD